MNSYSKVFVFFAVALCFVSTDLLSRNDGYTNFVIKGSAYINGNHYLSDFKQLPGIEGESPGYTSAFGPGASIGFGVEYIFDEQLFDSDFRYGFQVIYTNLSADYVVEEKIGNQIIGNSLGEPYYVEHRLEPSILAILTEHVFAVSPFDATPVSFLGGFHAGFLINNQYTQEQELTKPAGAEFLEGGSFRYKSSGETPEASSFYFALLIGARYEGFTIGDVSFEPELTYAYGLTNIVSSLDWKAGGARLGISVQYNVPKAVIPPPLLPPSPELPMPESPPKPKPALLELAVGIKNGNTDIAGGENVSYLVNISEYYEDFQFEPVLYYEKDKTIPAVVPAAISNILGMSNRINILEAAIEYLKKNKSVNLKIIPYVPVDEGEEAVAGRIEFITGRFDSAGLGDRYGVGKTSMVSEDFSYEELKDESRRIEFVFSNGAKTIKYKAENRKEYVAEGIELNLYADISAEAKPYVYKGRVRLPGRAAKEFSEENYTLSLSPQELLGMSGNNVNTIIFDASIEDAESGSIDKAISVNLIARRQIAVSYHNYNYKAGGSEYGYEQFVLGLCRFDKASFYYVDNDVVGVVKQALRAGKKVQLLALTDSLGSEVHNRLLAMKRVEAALNELMISDQDIEVIFPVSPLFPNGSAYGRTFNRSVIVRILQ